MYEIKLTNSADSDIKEIIFFINKQYSYNDAVSYLNKLEKAILSLDNFPERGSNPRYKILRNQGYNFVVVESHIIFYKIKEEKKIVVVNRVLHQKSEYQKFL